MNGTCFDKDQRNQQECCHSGETHRQVCGDVGSGGGGTGCLCCHLSREVFPCVARAEWYSDRHYTNWHSLSFVLQCTSTTMLGFLFAIACVPPSIWPC